MSVFDTPFLDRLAAAQDAAGSALCVGLDPDLDRLPDLWDEGTLVPERLVAFCDGIVEATADLACAYKPNSAFFEAFGAAGWGALERTIRHVRRIAPHALLVLDAKRADIGNTSRLYARAAFGTLRADALTVAPYMGRDSVRPFLDWPGRAVFVLARTSNDGARDVQDLVAEGRPVFEHVLRKASAWAEGAPGTLGFVAGAPDAEALARVRDLAPRAPLLVPGVGAQGGDPAAVMRANAGGPLLVNVGREILYAASDDTFATAARAAAKRVAESLKA